MIWNGLLNKGPVFMNATGAANEECEDEYIPVDLDEFQQEEVKHRSIIGDDNGSGDASGCKRERQELTSEERRHYTDVGDCSDADVIMQPCKIEEGSMNLRQDRFLPTDEKIGENSEKSDDNMEIDKNAVIPMGCNQQLSVSASQYPPKTSQVSKPTTPTSIQPHTTGPLAPLLPPLYRAGVDNDSAADGARGGPFSPTLRSPCGPLGKSSSRCRSSNKYSSLGGSYFPLSGNVSDSVGGTATSTNTSLPPSYAGDIITQKTDCTLKRHREKKYHIPAPVADMGLERFFYPEIAWQRIKEQMENENTYDSDGDEKGVPRNHRTYSVNNMPISPNTPFPTTSSPTSPLPHCDQSMMCNRAEGDSDGRRTIGMNNNNSEFINGFPQVKDTNEDDTKVVRVCHDQRQGRKSTRDLFKRLEEVHTLPYLRCAVPISQDYHFCKVRDKLGEGTYGAVYIGYKKIKDNSVNGESHRDDGLVSVNTKNHCTTGYDVTQPVAIKCLKHLPNFEGVPLTSIREIIVHRYLSSQPAGSHANLLVMSDLRFELQRSRRIEGNDNNNERKMDENNLSPSSCNVDVYLIFPYVEHNLSSLRRIIKAKVRERLLPFSHPHRQPSLTERLEGGLRMYGSNDTSSLSALTDPSHRPLEINEDLILHIFVQVLDGIKQLHAARIMHRDIKEDNILVTKEGIVKVCDFGLAVPVEGNRARITPSLINMFYRPPEMLLNARKYTMAVDVWSAGCLLAQQFLGVPPFISKNGQPGTNLEQLEIVVRILGPLPRDLFPPPCDVSCPSLSSVASSSNTQQSNTQSTRAQKGNNTNPYGFEEGLLDSLLKHVSRDLFVEAIESDPVGDDVGGTGGHSNKSSLYSQHNYTDINKNLPVKKRFSFSRWFLRALKERRAKFPESVAVSDPSPQTLFVLERMLELHPARRATVDELLTCTCSPTTLNIRKLMEQEEINRRKGSLSHLQSGGVSGGALSIQDIERRASDEAMRQQWLTREQCWVCMARSVTSAVSAEISKLPVPQTHLRAK